MSKRFSIKNLNMKFGKQAITAVVLAFLALGCRTYPEHPQSAASEETPQVTAPPEAFFAHIRERDRDAARKFYRKYIDIKGLPLAASAGVSDQALQRDYAIVTHMLAGRSDILQTMVTNGTRLIIIGKDQRYTDMPEYLNAPNPDYLNERVRGTGGFGITSFGEENLLCLPTDRYDRESIAVHEFCHTIDAALQRMDPTWRGRLRKTYQDAISKGLWKNTYAGSNQAEYWAEACQAYFDCGRANNWNHGPIARREQLKIYDPEVYELIRTTFNLSPAQDWRYHWLQKLPNVIPPPPEFKIDLYYTKFTWADEFRVIGRQASDEAMLKANDTICKMFAYRHDILKALMNNGVKLVVLGRNEKLSDLPELKGTTDTNIDHAARFMDYTPELKLLVVPEENVLGNPNDANVGPCLEIREFATALYDVCGTRPMDPNWNNHGRDIQQYELRVKRLDVQFDEKLKQLYEAAMSKGIWKNTPAVQDRVSYWAEGMLAYFDAAGQEGAPFKDAGRNGDFTDSPHPINTREALKAYDPDLYALVNETMAYDGEVDWRYTPYRP
jgi:hypothetical protein